MPVHKPTQGPSLVLIRHALPEINTAVPAAEWTLSQAGISTCESFARQLESFHPTTVYHSHEPKATQTAEIIARSLNLTCQSHPNLHEHDRRNYPFSSQHDFERDVQEFFRKPSEIVFGEESADEVHQRYTGAVMDILRMEDHQASSDIFIVSHGTVMSLLTARKNLLEPYLIWKQLTLPSAVILNRADFAFKKIIL